MNYQILKDIFRRSREYDDLVTVLKQPHRGKHRPYYISGLTEGAERIFLGTFCEDFRDNGDPILLVCADDKTAAGYRDVLLAMGRSRPAAKNAPETRTAVEPQLAFRALKIART